MPAHRLVACLASAVLLVGQPASAAEPRTEHTFRLADGESPPTATLDDAAWLVGSWDGTAFGQTFEEIWSPPSAGSMIGTFKLMDGDSVGFYELLLMHLDAGVLSLKVKHFNPDFSAWEEKADFVNFRLVKLDDNALHFSGISFYRLDDNRIEAFIVMRNGDNVREEKLTYTRRRD